MKGSQRSSSLEEGSMAKIRRMRLRIVAGKSLQSVAIPDYSALLVRPHYFRYLPGSHHSQTRRIGPEGGS